MNNYQGFGFDFHVNFARNDVYHQGVFPMVFWSLLSDKDNIDLKEKKRERDEER